MLNAAQNAANLGQGSNYGSPPSSFETRSPVVVSFDQQLKFPCPILVLEQLSTVLNRKPDSPAVDLL
jgi:hypothetical protein